MHPLENGEHMDGHTIQYSLVGYSLRRVNDTENMSDEEVVAAARRIYWRAPIRGWPEVRRFDRCPTCEAWTRTGGKLRKEINCPAVQAALAAV